MIATIQFKNVTFTIGKNYVNICSYDDKGMPIGFAGCSLDEFIKVGLEIQEKKDKGEI